MPESVERPTRKTRFGSSARTICKSWFDMIYAHALLDESHAIIAIPMIHPLKFFSIFCFSFSAAFSQRDAGL